MRGFARVNADFGNQTIIVLYLMSSPFSWIQAIVSYFLYSCQSVFKNFMMIGEEIKVLKRYK